MTQPGESGIPVREHHRVERQPKSLAFDVIAHCGPHAGHVMLDTYENEHAYFMSPMEATALGKALIDAAAETYRPPDYEDPPWLPRKAEG